MYLAKLRGIGRERFRKIGKGRGNLKLKKTSNAQDVDLSRLLPALQYFTTLIKTK